MAFGVRTLLAVALGRYINMSKNLLTVTAAAVSKALSLKCTKIEWQAWENRPRDAIASYVCKARIDQNKHVASTKHLKKNNTLELR